VSASSVSSFVILSEHFLFPPESPTFFSLLSNPPFWKRESGFNLVKPLVRCRRKGATVDSLSSALLSSLLLLHPWRMVLVFSGLFISGLPRLLHSSFLVRIRADLD